MSRGGARLGAGRPAGSRNKRTLALLEQASSEGELPLAYLLRVMRNPKTDPKRRDEAARAALPFCHARLTCTMIEPVAEPEPSSEMGRLMAERAASTARFAIRRHREHAWFGESDEAAG
jgi:hypothetical protein